MNRKNKPKIIFFGSDEYSLMVLKRLHQEQEFKITGVVSLATATVIKNFSQKEKIPLFDFTATKYLVGMLKKLRPKVGVLASFGKLLPGKILSIPRYGILNIHPSLLPKYRGPSPVQRAILNGDRVTGITIIKMDKQVDHGPIIAQFKEKVNPEETARSLYLRLFAAGSQVLTTILPAYLEGQIQPRKQNHSQATYTKKLTREDGFIPPKILKAALEGKRAQVQKTKGKVLPSSPSAFFLERFIRAMTPWPGAWTEIQQPGGQTTKRLKILKAHLAHLEQKTPVHQPKTIPERPKLVLDLVQLEGKKPVGWKQFCEGHPQAKIC